MEEKESSNITSIPQETISWLLGSQTPSIRYLTLTKLLHKQLDDADVSGVRSLIPASNPVKAPGQAAAHLKNAHGHFL